MTAGQRLKEAISERRASVAERQRIVDKPARRAPGVRFAAPQERR